MKSVTIILILLIICVCLPFFACFPQELQIENTIQATDFSIRKEIEEKLKTPSKKITEIGIKEEIEDKGPRFLVKKVQLLGAETYRFEEFKTIIEKYENKEVSLAELNKLAKEIQREYLRRGVITACFIPPQKVKDGVVILQIVESKMGELIIPEHKFFDKERLNYYWQIKQDEVLRYDKMAQSLYLMNKNPDRNCRAVLYPGKKPNTTDVILDVKTTLPWHFISSFDNDGVVTSGIWRRSFTLRHNNFLGFDDTLIAGYKYGEHFDVPYVYHSVPLTSHGTNLLYGYNYGKSFPKKQFEPFAIDSRSRNASFTVYQDLFKNSEYIGDVNLGIESKDKTVKYTGGTLYKERLRVIRLGADFVSRNFKSFTHIAPQISTGVNLWGARRDTVLSTRNAENTFWKFNLDFRHRKNLPYNFKADIKLKNQFALEKLTSQEAFALGGINSVRGYPPADYLADNAVQVNFELLIPSFFIPQSIKVKHQKKPLRDYITLLLFSDYGWGKKIDSEGYERKDFYLCGVGAGLKINLFDKAALQISWGFPIGEEPITEQSNSSFHFSLDINF